MPGITIGEGVLIGAYFIVPKDIPAWTVTMRRPAKVIKSIPKREKLIL